MAQGAVGGRGYFRGSEQSAERFSDGWVNTGDMVRVDEDGFISILDRVSDMIIVGGFNVYPKANAAIACCEEKMAHFEVPRKIQ